MIRWATMCFLDFVRGLERNSFPETTKATMLTMKSHRLNGMGQTTSLFGTRQDGRPCDGMLKYLNGIINSGIIPSEKTLSVTLSCGEDGQPLLENVKLITDLYKHHISCVCLIGGEEDQHELAQCFKLIRKTGLKTAFYTSLQDPSEVNKKVVDELDYLKFKGGKILVKDICPFGDIVDWVEA